MALPAFARMKILASGIADLPGLVGVGIFSASGQTAPSPPILLCVGEGVYHTCRIPALVAACDLLCACKGGEQALYE